MPAPIPEYLLERIRKFLERRSIDGIDRLEPIAVRKDRCVVFLYHLGTSYAIKCYAPVEQAGYERERDCYDRLLPHLEPRNKLVWLGSDDETGASLFLRSTGRELREKDIDRRLVQEATGFLLALNSDLTRQVQLGPAKDACRSVADHLHLITNQVSYLYRLAKSAGPQFQTYLIEELTPAWNDTLKSILMQFQTAGISPEQPLEPEQLVFSPGEFGFRNALLTPQREIIFLDFSHAGRDDPVRLICSFFGVGQLSPKMDYWDYVIQEFSSLPFLDQAFAVRARLLLPAYFIAGACHPILNFFELLNLRSSNILLSDVILKSRRRLAKALNTV